MNSPVTTRTTLHPGFEGSNIRTWVGFKHLMYLAQEAVLDHLRSCNVGPQRIFAASGLRLRIVESSLAFVSLLEADDTVVAEVTRSRPGRFQVRLLRDDPAGEVPLAKGHVDAGYVVGEGQCPADVPQELEPFLLSAAPRRGGEATPEASLQDPLWSWTARYFLCQFSDCVQHSAYVRALEETVDRYLAARGLTIGHVLADRGWIPVVSRARVRLLADAHMEELVHTVFVVDDVFKTTGYSGRMDCYVERHKRATHVATASIVHGYAVAAGAGAGCLTALDPATIAALSDARP